MSRNWIYAAFAVAVIAACDTAKPGMDQLFPGAGFEKGWSWQGKPKHYLPQNLYEYIDGEAELYLSYDFKELASLTYFWGSPADTFFTVDIYDMGTPVNAFGLYSSFRYPGYQYEKIGTEGFVSEFGLKFLKGRYVVEIKSSDESGKCRKAVRTVAGTLAERIPDPAVFPEVVSLLPSENQIPATLRYTAKEMLNQSFLPEGLEAKYRIGDEEDTGFVILFTDSASSREGLMKLVAFYRESGYKPVSGKLPGVIASAVRTPYHGCTLLALAGTSIVGIQDLTAPEKGYALIQEMVRAVSLKTHKP
jgi:hypothetical protein